MLMLTFCFCSRGNFVRQLINKNNKFLKNKAQKNRMFYCIKNKCDKTLMQK